MKLSNLSSASEMSRFSDIDISTDTDYWEKEPVKNLRRKLEIWKLNKIEESHENLRNDVQ